MISKKGLAFLLYAIYATAMTLLLIFGGSVAEWAFGVADDKLNKKQISDVIVDVDTDVGLMAGEYYYVKFTPKGKFRKDAGLKLTSLDPEYLTVTGNGQLYANMDFDGDELYARVKVTSIYDTDFEKVITFRFVKKYPENFSVVYYAKGYGWSPDTLYVGAPIHVSSEVDETENGKYNVKTYTVEYDEEYFARSSGGTLTPIKPTEGDDTLTLTLKYANGAVATSKEFKIAERGAPVSGIDGIMIDGISLADFVGVPSGKMWLTLISNGEPVATDYSLVFENENDVLRRTDGSICFKTPGEKKGTLTLPSGDSMDISLIVRNKIELPTATESEVASTHVISMLDSESRAVKLTFPGDVTYKTINLEYDPEVLSASYSSQILTVTPIKPGSSYLKLSINDGYERIEDVYTVNIERDTSLIGWVNRNLEIFVAKLLGHAILFAALAFLSMNMFRYIDIKNVYLRLSLYTATALPIAALTELVQHFIPARSGRFVDVLIDMLAFYVGTALVIALRNLRARMKKNKEGLAEADENPIEA